MLVDIGAAAGPQPKWRAVAPHAICVAVEGNLADDSGWESGFHELHRLPAVVAERPGRVPFYLTRFPFCSSLLRPNQGGLDPYAFSPLFDLARVDGLPAVGRVDVLP